MAVTTLIGFELEPGDEPAVALQDNAVHRHLSRLGPTGWLLLLALSEAVERTDNGRGVTTVEAMANWLGVQPAKVHDALRRLHRFGFITAGDLDSGIDVCIHRTFIPSRNSRRAAATTTGARS